MPVFLAEIVDKEPSLVQLWGIGVFLSVVALYFAHLRWWAVLAPLALAAIWAAAVISELRDPDLGPAILQELGRGYVIQSVIAIASPFVFAMIGLLRARRNAV